MADPGIWGSSILCWNVVCVGKLLHLTYLTVYYYSIYFRGLIKQYLESAFVLAEELCIYLKRVICLCAFLFGLFSNFLVPSG